MPEFMPISLRIGPLTTEIVAHEVVLLERAVMPLADIARITGKYSGRAPAITAFTATFSTSNAHASRNAVGRMRPMILSRGCFVPLSILSTRSSVGRMIGMKSVHRCSMKSSRRLSSVSGGKQPRRLTLERRAFQILVVERLREALEHDLHERPLRDRIRALDVGAQLRRRAADDGLRHERVARRRHASRERRGFREAREHVGADRDRRHALLL